MNRRACWGVVGVIAALAAPAQGREDPLLVVVEAAPAVGVDAAEIRRAVGAELRAAVVPPDQVEPTPSRALVVAVNRDRIAVSFRPGGDAPVSRAIPTPADHAERLRAIAWLAGNVARDQVGPLLNETTVDLPYAGAADLAAPAPPAPSPLASPLPTEPPPLTHEPAAVVSAAAAVTATRSAWSVSLAVGPTFTPFGVSNGFSDTIYFGLRHPLIQTAWQVAIEHRPAGGGTILGADVEGTSGTLNPQILGVAGLVGREWRFRHWRADGLLGGGLEAAQATNVSWTWSPEARGMVETVSSGSKPALFLRGALAAALPLSDSTELVAQLGVHASSVSFGGWYGTASLGLRYTLP